MPTKNTYMQGKICLVTGATSGIGKATALGLAQQSATVIIVARDDTRGQVAQHEIQTKSDNSEVHLLQADLSSQASIRQLAETVQQHYSQLHVLINNAGVMQLKRQESVDGLEMTLAVNHLAPFLLTNLLLDMLKASAPARIINVASDAYKSGTVSADNLQSQHDYHFWRAYARSKFALVLCTYELARILQGTGVTANCLHPGFVGTNIGTNNVGPNAGKVLKFILSRLGTSSENGAKTSLYLATSPDVEDVTGKYFAKSAPQQSIPLTHDETLQQQIWAESARLVHLTTAVSQ